MRPTDANAGLCIARAEDWAGQEGTLLASDSHRNPVYTVDASGTLEETRQKVARHRGLRGDLDLEVVHVMPGSRARLALGTTVSLDHWCRDAPAHWSSTGPGSVTSDALQGCSLAVQLLCCAVR